MTRAGLYVLPADGGVAVELLADERSRPFFASWSPDGRSVAALATDGETIALHVRPADGGGPPAAPLVVGYPLYLAWAPGGRALAVHRNGDADRTPSAELSHVVVGGRRRALPFRPSSFRAPAYAPDGRSLLAAGAARGQARGLSLVPLDGRRPRLLVRSDAVPAFVLSPRGDRVAVAHQAPGLPGLLEGLDVVDLATGAATRWHDGDLVAFFWSPDGARLAWVAADPSGSELAWFVADAPGAGQRVVGFTPSHLFETTLGFFDQYAATLSLWSPDGRRLLFAGWSGGSPLEPSRIWVVEAAAGAEPRAVAAGVMASWSPPAWP